jgi:antitoxin CptB
VTTRSSEGLNERRRRLLYRAWHRGLREADLILGRFADDCVATLGDVELDEFERLLEAPSRELVSWVMGEYPPPPDDDTTIFRRLKAYYSLTSPT